MENIKNVLTAITNTINEKMARKNNIQNISLLLEDSSFTSGSIKS